MGEEANGAGGKVTFRKKVPEIMPESHMGPKCEKYIVNDILIWCTFMKNNLVVCIRSF